MQQGWDIVERWAMEKSIMFWEYCWFGSSSLAIQYWPLYVMVNEKGRTIDQAWDGNNLKFTFRRAVSAQVMNLWWKVVETAKSITFIDDCGSIV